MKKPFLERALETGLFRARWLMAPFYVGLIAAVAALLVVFFQELVHQIPMLWTFDPVTHAYAMTADDAIMLALSLIDLSLAANLVVIVMFSGYENFVSKIDTGENEDRPEWMGTVDFSALKLKLVASIVAISGIALLKSFLALGDGMEFTPVARDKLMWQVIVHLTFVVSGVLLALMDWLTGHQKD
ncbi:MAG: TIGR00645 family protein [Hyphomonadaceae bacterium]|nr:TIGR00645 family protein [Hyphomonadaceae bacterium]MBP9233844.1 TIGR00645 family protein [Hyphomonadaceae bacterium]